MNDVQYLGKHFILDLYDCNKDKINNEKLIEEILKDATRIGNICPIKIFIHKFGEMGISGMIIMEKSHISIHTWPEFNFVSIDIFTSNFEDKIEDSIQYIVTNLEGKRYSGNEIQRGNHNKFNI